MKGFLFHNDKSTVKDEMLLLLFILICIGAGLLFYIFAPTDWVISNSTIKIFGIVWIIAGAMFVPGFVYRLFSNNKNSKE